MKKIFFATFYVAILAMVSYAQTSQLKPRIAVLELKAGSGVSQNDVDGISGMFITNFSPNGYDLVERGQIDRVIKEQGFQAGELTQDEMVQIGQILNVSHIVMGDVVSINDEYNVDVRVVAVEGGEIIAKDGISFQKNNSFRETMKTLAERFAGSVPIPVPAVRSEPTPAPTTKEDLVNQFIVQYRYYFKPENITDVKRMLIEMDDAVFNELLVHNKLKNPSSIQIASYFGFLGIDRFMLGQNGWGLLKIPATYFTVGIWWIVDMFTAKDRARTYNYKYIKETPVVSDL